MASLASSKAYNEIPKRHYKFEINITFTKNSDLDVIGYNDADWANNPADRKKIYRRLCFYIVRHGNFLV